MAIGKMQLHKTFQLTITDLKVALPPTYEAEMLQVRALRVCLGRGEGPALKYTHSARTM